MAIEFTCDSCGQMVRTPESVAGKKGRCPYCQAVVQIPNAAALPSAAKPSSVPSPAVTASGGAKGAIKNISFPCPSCGKTTKAPSEMAGKRARCPNCKAVVDIPGAKSPAATASPGLQPVSPSVGLQPLGPASGLMPLGTPSGLQPLGSLPGGGLQPLGPSPGLQPLGPASGLQPMGPSPGGLQPLGGAGGFGQPGAYGATNSSDPFGSLVPVGSSGTANPFGDASFGGSSIPNPLGGSTLAPNPYLAPSSASYKPSYDDSRPRRGLPWQREQDSDAFMETVKRVLFEFPTAFRDLRVNGNIGTALSFLVFAQIAAYCIQCIYSLILNVVLLAAVGGEQAGAAIGGVLIGFVLQLVLGVMFAALGAVVGSFLMAGVYHICLLVMGAANNGFEATYNAGCYASGAGAMMVLVPCVGPVVSLFLLPVILIFAFMHAHNTSGLRATFAVLLPYLLCVAGVAFLFFAIFAAALGMGN